MKKVLILEDELNIRGFVAINLHRAGYTVLEAADGREALECLRQNPDVSVALLDVTLPGMDGFEVCRRIRAAHQRMGIIMLTARAQEMDKAARSAIGADDYLAKPFSSAELTARVEALLRRTSTQAAAAGEILSYGPFVMNVRNYTLDKNGQRVPLTQAEFGLMKLFLSNPGRPISRQVLLARVWGQEAGAEEKLVDVTVRRLRIKIEDDTANPKYIVSVWNHGYQWGV